MLGTDTREIDWQKQCDILATGLKHAQQQVQELAQALELERTRNEIWQLKEDKRQLEYELSMVRKNSAGAPTRLGELYALTVEHQEGRCLTCNQRAALYCDEHCAAAGKLGK